jgi:exonuclease III
MLLVVPLGKNGQCFEISFPYYKYIITMKKLLNILVFMIGIGINVYGQKEIKVITYNILEGLGNNATYGEDRHDNCVKWLQSQKADVIALQEMYGSETQLAIDAKAWGHDYYVKSGSVAITSNRPITVKKIYSRKDLRNNVIHCQTYGIDILGIHLSPADWKYRLGEAGIINDILDSISVTTNKYMVLGDFNSHSPFDADLYAQNPDLALKYLKGDRANEAKASPDRNLMDENVDYSVISKFLSFPLIDVTQRFVPVHMRHSFPTPILIGVWRTAGNIGRTPERIDYIMCSLELSKFCKGVKVHNGEGNDYISDHYPVEATFKVGD